MRIHECLRMSMVLGRCQDDLGGDLRHRGSLQLMNSLKGCLLGAAVRPEFGSGNLIRIIVFLRYL